MAGENSYFPNQNSNYPGDHDPYLVFPTPGLSPTDISDCSLNGWDFEIDRTRLNPSHLLSDADGINPYGFTMPPDSDLGSTSSTASGRDQSDVQNYQISLSSLLINIDDDTKDLEHGPKMSNSELNMWLNELGLENEQSMDARKGKKKDKGGRPVIPISYEKLLQCKGRKQEAAAKVLDVSVSTLKRHLEPLTGYKTWKEFQRSLSVS